MLIVIRKNTILFKKHEIKFEVPLNDSFFLYFRKEKKKAHEVAVNFENQLKECEKQMKENIRILHEILRKEVQLFLHLFYPKLKDKKNQQTEFEFAPMPPIKSSKVSTSEDSENDIEDDGTDPNQVGYLIINFYHTMEYNHKM